VNTNQSCTQKAEAKHKLRLRNSTIQYYFFLAKLQEYLLVYLFLEKKNHFRVKENSLLGNVTFAGPRVNALRIDVENRMGRGTNYLVFASTMCLQLEASIHRGNRLSPTVLQSPKVFALSHTKIL
jgi:hypothetical protein